MEHKNQTQYNRYEHWAGCKCQAEDYSAGNVFSFPTVINHRYLGTQQPNSVPLSNTPPLPSRLELVQLHVEETLQAASSAQ